MKPLLTELWFGLLTDFMKRCIHPFSVPFIHFAITVVLEPVLVVTGQRTGCQSFVGPLHVWYCQILPSTYKEKKHTSNLNRKCVKKKHYTYILVTILHRIFAHWVKSYIYLLFFASIYFKMQYSNMLLLLMALMQACSVNRNLSNAITIVCVIHWSLIRSWWGYGLSHSIWGIVNKT